MRIKQLLFSPGQVTDTWGAVGLLVARLWAGLTLAFAHGWGKVPPSEGFVEGVRGLGFPMPELFAWAAGLAELAGGLCLALGLATRPAAFFVGFTMLTAGLGKHLDDPFGKKELSLCYLAFALLFLFAGAGKFSADAKLGRSA